jgi:predicted cupin superfamily sugar epimerase
MVKKSVTKLEHKKGSANMETAKHIVEMLGLKPHPTCGFVAETYRSKQKIPQQALPAAYEGSRPFGSVLYFMVAPQAQIRLHCIRFDQMYHHYLGDPLEVLLLYPGGSGEVKVIGSDLAAGMRPQLFIPGSTFHISRLRKGTVSPCSELRSGRVLSPRTSNWAIGIS